MLFILSFSRLANYILRVANVSLLLVLLLLLLSLSQFVVDFSEREDLECDLI